MQTEWNNDPILKFKPESLSLSREDLYIETVRKTVQTQKVIGLTTPKAYKYLSFLLENPNMGAIHRVMFMPAIELLGTDEQAAKWIPDCYYHKVIGCYAQTELGHGSDVQGLQTTATYD